MSSFLLAAAFARSTARHALALVAIVCLAFTLGACSKNPYSQETPEATIAAARLMIEKGEAAKLPDLIYATDPEMRRWLKALGRLTGDLATLSGALQDKFPKEVAELRARAEEAAKKGKATTLLGQIAQQARGSAGRPRVQVGAAKSRTPERPDSKGFSDALTGILADPFAFLSGAEQDLTTAPMTDETVALLYKGKPVLAPLGMTMRQAEDAQWYFELPLNIPGAEKFVPQTKEQWEIMGKLVVTLDKMTKDLTREVQEGRHASLEGVSRRAGEMTFVPAAMVVYSYAKFTGEAAKAEKK